MKALVTGASGFVGGHLVEALLPRYEVSCLVRKTSNVQWLKDLGVRLVNGDLLFKGSLVQPVKDVDYVYHLAATAKAMDAETLFRVNCQGTSNLLAACSENSKKLKRFVHISSQWAVGPSRDGVPLTEADECSPLTPYGKSKLDGERTAREFSETLPVTIIRPCSVYGPRSDSLLGLFRMVKKGIKLSLGLQPRQASFVHVKDLIQGIILASESDRSAGQIYFLSDGEIHSWDELNDLIAKILDTKAIRVRVPKSFIMSMAFIGEVLSLLSRRPIGIDRQKAREMTEMYWACNISKAKNELGFQPTIPLEIGLRETANWYIEKGLL